MRLELNVVYTATSFKNTHYVFSTEVVEDGGRVVKGWRYTLGESNPVHEITLPKEVIGLALTKDKETISQLWDLAKEHANHLREVAELAMAPVETLRAALIPHTESTFYVFGEYKRNTFGGESVLANDAEEAEAIFLQRYPGATYLRVSKVE